MPDEFPANSNKAKNAAEPAAPEIKVEKVIAGEAIRRKKPLMKRFAETSTGEDNRSVMSYVVFDIMIPAAKDMIADVVTQGVERKLWGEARSTSRRTGRRVGFNDSPYGHVRYDKMSSREEPRREISRRGRAIHDFEEVIIPTRPEAGRVIDTMGELIDKQGFVTVGDFYTMVDMPSNYTDEKWGWLDIRDARIERVRNGYLLDLPRPEPLD